MQTRFTSRELAAAILYDLRDIRGAQRYLQIKPGAQKLLDKFSRVGCKEELSEEERIVMQAKSLRGALSPRVSGGNECVYAFYNAVLAYDERACAAGEALGRRKKAVRILASTILGDDRTVDMS